MNEVYLLLGSNLGDRLFYLNSAITAIKTKIAPIVQRSSVYQTKAWGKTDEPDYLNQVLKLQTLKQPSEILNLILTIEEHLGRKRSEKWGSRTIDIDILFYGDRIVNEPDLVIPHPQLHLRKFTLAPLAEIAPQLIHPVLNLSIANINALNTDMAVKYTR